MGLAIAKQYVNYENQNKRKELELHFNGTRHLLKKDQWFLFPGDKYLELIFNGDEIKIVSGDQDRMSLNSIHNIFVIAIIETGRQNTRRVEHTYPLDPSFTAVSVIKYNEDEYEYGISRLK